MKFVDHLATQDAAPFEPWDPKAFPRGYHTQLNARYRAAAQKNLAQFAVALGDPSWFACESRLKAILAAERGEGVGEA